LTYSGWLTHISGHPSATSRAQDSESTKDQCYTAGPRNQPVGCHSSQRRIYTLHGTYGWSLYERPDRDGDREEKASEHH